MSEGGEQTVSLCNHRGESRFLANDGRILGVYMKILNKRVSQRFASFYTEIVAQIGEPTFCLTQTPGRGECRFVDETLVISLQIDLNKSSFEQHIAHELTHALQRKEGWPLQKKAISICGNSG